MAQQKVTKKLPKVITKVDDFGRKKFILQQNHSDNEQEEQSQQKFIDTGRYTSTLQGREQRIDTDKYLGKIQGTKKKKKTQVFYCEVCKVGFKCDLAYITHVNSPSHNRKLGMNMKVQAVSVQTVAQKLARMAEQKGKSKVERMMEKKLGKEWEKKLINGNQKYENLQDNTKNANKNGKVRNSQDQHQQNSDKQQNQQQENKNEEQEVADQDEQSQDPDQKMMRQLGLPTSFSSKKKKY